MLRSFRFSTIRSVVLKVCDRAAEEPRQFSPPRPAIVHETYLDRCDLASGEGSVGVNQNGGTELHLLTLMED